MILDFIKKQYNYLLQRLKEAKKEDEERAKPKCLFCYTTSNLLREGEYHNIGVYSGFMYYDYHEKCLLKILENPKEFGHKAVDKALHINYLIEVRLKAENKRKEDTKKAVKRIKGDE